MAAFPSLAKSAASGGPQTGVTPAELVTWLRARRHLVARCDRPELTGKSTQSDIAWQRNARAFLPVLHSSISLASHWRLTCPGRGQCRPISHAVRRGELSVAWGRAGQGLIEQLRKEARDHAVSLRACLPRPSFGSEYERGLQAREREGMGGWPNHCLATADDSAVGTTQTDPGSIAPGRLGHLDCACTSVAQPMFGPAAVPAVRARKEVMPSPVKPPRYASLAWVSSHAALLGMSRFRALWRGAHFLPLASD